MRTVRPSLALAALAALAASLASTPARADVTAAPLGASADVPFWKRVEAHGWVDVYGAYNANKPADSSSFLPGTGTTGKRANELALSQAALGVSLDPDPIGFAFGLHVGTGPSALHEVDAGVPGLAAGPWTIIQRASVAAKIPIGSGLLVEAGILPSFIGLESFASKDNWSYTRAWLAELSPYFLTGVHLEYEVVPRFKAALYATNGWQEFGDVNHGKSFGARLGWEGDRVTVALSGIAGPELPSDDRHVRALADLYAVVKATRWLQVAAAFDLGAEQRAPTRPLATGEEPSRLPSVNGFWGVAGYARAAVLPFLALAARGEVYGDPHGVTSGYGQRLAEGTLTLEGRPHEALILKLEGRYDRSTTPVFGLSQLVASGTPEKGRDQALVVLGAVAQF
jgi:hypothetical protein